MCLRSDCTQTSTCKFYSLFFISLVYSSYISLQALLRQIIGSQIFLMLIWHRDFCFIFVCQYHFFQTSLSVSLQNIPILSDILEGSLFLLAYNPLSVSLLVSLRKHARVSTKYRNRVQVFLLLGLNPKSENQRPDPRWITFFFIPSIRITFTRSDLLSHKPLLLYFDPSMGTLLMVFVILLSLYI